MNAPETPPAFPSPRFADPSIGSTGGMTLRDWFAGQVIAGLMASYSNMDNIESCELAAVAAYKQADVLLAARSRKPEGASA